MSRQPNGYGSCHKIGGNKKRAKPYRVRVTDGWVWDEQKQQAVQKYRTLGYYATRKEGNIALAEYNKNPARKGTADLTFSDLYQLWLGSKTFEPHSLAAYKTAYNNSRALHGIKIKDIRTEHLETVMQNVTVGIASQRIIKTLWNQLFSFAESRDYVQKNYAKNVRTKDKSTTKSNRQPFSKEEIQKLWEHVDILDGADSILIMIYTGMRPTELLLIHKDNVHLDERYMVGGIKTSAGRNRIIPIHSKILPLIKKRMEQGDYLLPTFKGAPLEYRRYLSHFWNPIKEQLGFDHTPHECRHTGISLMTMAGIDNRILKQIVGHSTGDITERYTHTYIENLVEAINRVG